jgi:GT2 family glycosyltransferase
MTKQSKMSSTKEVIKNSYVQTFWIVNMILKKTYLFFFKSSINPTIQTKTTDSTIQTKTISILIRFLSGVFTPLTLIFICIRNYRNMDFRSEYIDANYRISFDHRNKTVVFFSPVDWDYRIQRPQQLAIQFQRMGFNVIYLNPTIQPSQEKNQIEINVINGIQVCTLFDKKLIRNKYIGVHGFPSRLVMPIARNIEALISSQPLESAILLIQQPSWWPLVERLQGNQVIFDCMDLHKEFDLIDRNVIELESMLDKSADAIVVSSPNLLRSKEIILDKPIVLIRNGVDNSIFSYKQSIESYSFTTVGYFGAIAEWFDIALMEYLLVRNPQIHFELIGLVSNPDVFKKLRKFPNLVFFGEVPNSELPNLTIKWKAGLIPFLSTNLIAATNPVKMYEYAALGIPTVSTAISEVELASLETTGVFTSSTFEGFNKNLALAVSGETFEVDDLISWAKNNDWLERAHEIIQVTKLAPKVSIIILMWNQGQLTLSCLKSVLQRSDYENLEIILVDNNSIPEEISIVMSWVETYAQEKVTYIRNEKNLGFAGGNNQGLTIASGDFIVILNNDTEVSPGWIWRSLKHFHRNPKLGLLGPSTDNCGNEARIVLRGHRDDWLQESITRFNFRVPFLLKVDTVAFFCVFFKREVIDEVGLISEEYGRGYFEDDDYCRRTQTKGYEIGIARDVFVHHRMGASFNLLEDLEKMELFNYNKKVYETKWGPWKPHTYALDPDQL